MPTFIIEGPQGLRTDAKAAMMAEITVALKDAYHIPDIRIFLSEHSPANAAQDGRIEAEPIRPVCFVEGPRLASLDARRALVETLNGALAKAFTGLANTDDILILFNEYPLEFAGAGGHLQSENPEMAAIGAAAE
jgi:phenylpyruvate tautomerase PptA (4-oxalocrotonate tautomerase family)